MSSTETDEDVEETSQAKVNWTTVCILIGLFAVILIVLIVWFHMRGSTAARLPSDVTFQQGATVQNFKAGTSQTEFYRQIQKRMIDGQTVQDLLNATN